MKFLKKLKLILKNLPNFFRKEEREIKYLLNGKESFKKFQYNFSFIFRDFFIPNSKNSFKPKILRTKFLTIIITSLVSLKIISSIFLFIVYPNIALMSENISSDIYKITNQERIANNLLPLKLNDNLNKLALQKANDMFVRNYFSHKSPDGKMIWNLIDRNKYPYIDIGENLGMNFITAEAVNDALMKSPTHRKNILNQKFTDVGIAVVSGIMNNKRTNILVQVFGSKENIKKTNNIKILPETKITEKKSLKEIVNLPKTENKTMVLSVEKEIKAEQIEKNIKNTSTNIYLAQKEQINKKPTSTLFKKLIKNKKDNLFPIGQIKNTNHKNNNFAINFMDWSRLIFKIILFILFISLLVNIFVEITIQHKPIILQTVFVLIIIFTLLSVKISFVETIAQNIKII